uniref:3-oxoacyl-[acyl-carrier-protein] reductase FabG n=2 Tax=Acrobeloides nanus TaxID=290746 RepID=A0A914EE39_9BILA
MSKIFSLAGKTAIITGASSGIGRSTAVLFNSLDASLLLTGRNAEKLDELVQELTKTNATKEKKNQIHVVTADLAKEEDVNSIFTVLKNKFDNKLDILVNNAGILERGTILDSNLEQYDRVMNINLRALYQLTALAAPLLIKTKGNIVNVSSVNGIRSFPGVLAYNISKAGVDQLTRCTALELAPHGVRVNSVNPGVTVTNLHLRSGMDETAYKAFLDNSKNTHALGRAGTVEEVAQAIAFVASDAASFITGASIPVDGGRHAMCPR